MPPEKNKAIGKKSPSPVEEIKKGMNHLLAIGINDYLYCPKLNNAVKDIEDFEALMIEKFGFEKKNTKLIRNHEATYENILNEFERLINVVKPDDSVIIYFSGHGELKTAFDEGYWVPFEAERNKINQYIPNSTIQKVLPKINSFHTFLLIDSCYSGSMFLEGKGKFISDSYDFHSRWGLTSGRNTIVNDGKPGTNSPFAKELLDSLKHINMPMNVSALCDVIKQAVPAATNKLQMPIGDPLNIEGHKGGQFIFIPKNDEESEWKIALQRNTEWAYLNYLDKYPQGEFVKEAEKRLKELADEKEWQNVLRINAAFAYREYLWNYPKGIHAHEAEAKLNFIKATEQRQAEAERLEQERLAKTEADRKERELIEKEKIEQARAEAERLERDRVAKAEANKKEREHIEKEKIEQARVEAERLERERVAKVEADRIEHERIEKEKIAQREQLENNKRLERERLAIIEADIKEQARLYKKNEQKQALASFFQKFRLPLVGVVVLVLGLIIWKLALTFSQNTTPLTNNNLVLTQLEIENYEPEMVEVVGGKFKMGSDDKNAGSDEKPVHTVTVSSFQIGKYEVTQAQWQAVMGNNPSYSKGDSLPVEQVSWEDVQDYLKKLNAKTGKKYRLPTEAEWEFAARGGIKSKKYVYSGSNDVNLVGWTVDNPGTHSVGQKQANELGLYDMSGNVWDWCSDWYDADYYKSSPSSDPQGAASGSSRVIRGGGWGGTAEYCRVSYRDNSAAANRAGALGFRVVSLSPQ